MFLPFLRGGSEASGLSNSCRATQPENGGARPGTHICLLPAPPPTTVSALPPGVCGCGPSGWAAAVGQLVLALHPIPVVRAQDSADNFHVRTPLL